MHNLIAKEWTLFKTFLDIINTKTPHGINASLQPLQPRNQWGISFATHRNHPAEPNNRRTIQLPNDGPPMWQGPKRAPTNSIERKLPCSGAYVTQQGIGPSITQQLHTRTEDRRAIKFASAKGLRPYRSKTQGKIADMEKPHLVSGALARIVVKDPRTRGPFVSWGFDHGSPRRGSPVSQAASNVALPSIPPSLILIR
jgi:hypothetical protein